MNFDFHGGIKMVSETQAKNIIMVDTRKRLDFLGYGEKIKGAGCIYYIVRGKRLTASEYYRYCLKMELKKFGIKE